MTPQDRATSYRDDFRTIEAGMRSFWREHRCHVADLERTDRPKEYVLGMFPYPSGNAHLGHILVYTISDVLARLGRFKGRAVLHPLGWDAFGLPAENAAIKNNTDPRDWTASNIAVMREQILEGGFSFDESKEINTSSPEFYKWTQWLFLKLMEHGYVYRSESWVNWDPVDGTVLANEQVIDGRGWRSGAPIERRQMAQWTIRITAFAEALHAGLDKLAGWSERAIAAQRYWIGRSEGFEVVFGAEAADIALPVFTTRIDTLFGVTAIVVAPEHKDIDALTADDRRAEVTAYCRAALTRTEVDRLASDGKSGVFVGRHAVHPVTGERVPIFVADYVISGYGSDAVMCVPAHDQRDADFAAAHGLAVRTVISPDGGAATGDAAMAFKGEGVLIDSGEFTGLRSTDARARMAERLEAQKLGRRAVRYRLRDWTISRQRFWGCPIPVVWRRDGRFEPVKQEDLPVLLPLAADFHGAGGRSPLAHDPAFLSTVSADGEPATREVDTMDTFMCSAWYAWRFLAPHDHKAAWDAGVAKRWMPIDRYVGGLEHASQHLIYFRFLSHFLHSIGLTPTKEPVSGFLDNGMVRMDGSKMSKSKGNVVSPTSVIERHGADALRLYLLADTPFERDRDWTGAGVAAKHAFVAQIWSLLRDARDRLPRGAMRAQPPLADEWSRAKVAELYKAALSIEDELENRRGFHVAIARIHVIASEGRRVLAEADTPERKRVAAFYLQNALKLIGLFAPHIAEWGWRECFGVDGSLFREQWPPVDRAVIESASSTMVIPVTVDGKKRAELRVDADWADPRITEALAPVRDKLIGTHLPTSSEVGIRIVRHTDGRPRLVNLVSEA